MIGFSFFHLSIGMAILAAILIFLARQRRSFWYLLFFSIFWIYLLFVVSVIVFPIVPLSKEYWATFKPSVNLVPFYFGTCELPRLCLINVVGNILLTMPFGFGISFIAPLKPRDFLWLAISVGLACEGTQLAVSLAYRSVFRAVDINDVILNAIGVWVGYALFRVFGWLYLHTASRFATMNRHLFAYLYDVVRQSTAH
jgi:glycopeptide antibiotics resistance protein